MIRRKSGGCDSRSAGVVGVLFLLAILLAGEAFPGISEAGAKEPTPAEKLAETWKAYEDAEEYEASVEVLEALKKSSAEAPEDWLTHLWTAYAHTQLGRWAKMEKKEGAMAYLDGAQNHLDRALALPSSGSDEARSSLYALQSLVYDFRTWFSDKPAEGDENPHEAMEAEAVQRAVRIGPENPAVEILVATNLIDEGGREKDLGKVIAAKALLEKAKVTIDQAGGPATGTPYWNVGWLSYWTSQTHEILATVKKKEMEAKKEEAGKV